MEGISVTKKSGFLHESIYMGELSGRGRPETINGFNCL